MYSCPHCGFESMNRNVLEIHIEERHKLKRQDQRKQCSVAGINLAKVRVKLRSGETIEGEVAKVTTYEIVVGKKIVFKHAID